MKRGAAVAAVVLCASIPATGFTQTRPGFAVERYEPAEAGARYFVVDALDLRARRVPSFGATFDYAYEPLLVYDASGAVRSALVRHQLVAHASASYVVVDRIRIGADLPLAIDQDGETTFVNGETLGAASAPAIGDLRLAADVRLAGTHESAARVAAGLRGWLPIGRSTQFTSDGAIRLAPQVLAAGNLGALSWATRGAFVWRAREDTYAGSPIGSELAAAAGLGVRVGRVLVGPEAFATFALEHGAFLSAHGTPVEALLGVHYDHPSGLNVSLGGGTGLTHGYGSPLVRMLLAIGFSEPIAEPPPDRDGDGIADEHDACPDLRGVPSGDPELNGCPPPERVPEEDSDADGISDTEDACPTVPGVRTADPMTNGCPSGTPRQLAVVTSNEIRIGEEIRFATDSADLVDDSGTVLDAVRQLLDAHPEIELVRVEGHTDDTGDPGYNEELSKRRAAAVVRWLVDRGIANERLTSAGFGSKQPIDTNATEEGRAKNRRVAFTILKRRPR